MRFPCAIVISRRVLVIQLGVHTDPARSRGAQNHSTDSTTTAPTPEQHTNTRSTHDHHHHTHAGVKRNYSCAVGTVTVFMIGWRAWDSAYLMAIAFLLNCIDKMTKEGATQISVEDQQLVDYKLIASRQLTSAGDESDRLAGVGIPRANVCVSRGSGWSHGDPLVGTLDFWDWLIGQLKLEKEDVRIAEVQPNGLNMFAPLLRTLEDPECYGGLEVGVDIKMLSL